MSRVEITLARRAALGRALAPHLPWAIGAYRCTDVLDGPGLQAHRRRCGLRPHNGDVDHAALVDGTDVVRWRAARPSRLAAWWRRWSR